MTEIIVQKGILQTNEWLEKISGLGSHFVIVTDTTVEKLYGKKLQDAGVSLFSIPPGEKSKTREQKERLEDLMLEKKLGRDTVMIALGGGVVTDLAGFVAATYLRGIPLVMIPTTLLGMVDASIGGKVGVNTKHGKNLIGAYYLPKLIIVDTELLDTLPEKELQNGFAEILKYGFIHSRELLEMEISDELIKKAIAIKKEIVALDPQEKGLRRILNFGHTLGHAIEVCSHYTLSHGEAVAIGMHLEAHLSAKLGFLKESDVAVITSQIKKRGLPLHLPQKLGAIMDALSLDKKSTRKQPRFVLLEKIGKVMSFEGEYCAPVDAKIVSAVLEEHGQA